MAFLDELEKLQDEPDSPPQNMRYPIVFFVKDPKSTAKIDDKSTPMEGLRRTEIMLESLNFRQSLRVMHQGLAKLFDACEVEHSMDTVSQEELLPKRRYVLRHTLFVSVFRSHPSDNST